MATSSVTCRDCQFACGLPATFVRPVEFTTCPSTGKPEKAPAASIADMLVLLYYSYVEIVDVDSALSWHRDMCLHLNLYGRVRVAPEGVNVVCIPNLRPAAI